MNQQFACVGRRRERGRCDGGEASSTPTRRRRFADLDDAALVAAAAAGRREAFDVIVERHRRTVYQVCYRFVNNHEDASDLAQEAFVRAWRGLEEFQGRSRRSRPGSIASP